TASIGDLQPKTHASNSKDYIQKLKLERLLEETPQQKHLQIYFQTGVIRDIDRNRGRCVSEIKTDEFVEHSKCQFAS
ncbi:MAG: hypothetical protein OXG97_02025, partial [Candidatus Poribacteria bacterium]|nr:hypothetical protein [Candidatus Poribacteria bacterium]